MIAALCFDPLPLYLTNRADPDSARTPLVHAEEQRVTHANAVAKRHGVDVGMRLEGARMRVEGLQVVTHNEPTLQHAWQELLRELHEHTPWLESRVRGRVLARLDRDEAAGLADHYQARVGLAEDCETAELAALATRSGTCKVVPDTDSFLTRLPLRFLRGVGVGKRNLTRLQWLGLVTAGDLAAWTASQLTSYLGAEGERLLPYLHGPRRSALLPFNLPAVISRSFTFYEPAREPYHLLPALARLAGELEGELGGRAARRLTLTANLPNGTLRASRLSKRPLTQARHIRQQALFALRDSDAEGRTIERLTVELAAPERIGIQQGIWQQRERRQRAYDATSERFPHAPRQLTWRDPHAQAGDLAWAWLAPSASALAESSTSTAAVTGSNGVAARHAARKAAQAATVSTAAFQAAGKAVAVPLFEASSPPVALTLEVTVGTGPDAVHHDDATVTDQLLLFSPRIRQRYTEPFPQEERHAPTVDTSNRDPGKPTTNRRELVPQTDQAAA